MQFLSEFNPIEIVHDINKFAVEEPDFLYSSRFKAEREIWILANLAYQLKRNGHLHPVWAVKQDPPDFNTQFNDGTDKLIEVTEILFPGRKRGKERLESLEFIPKSPSEELLNFNSISNHIKSAIMKKLIKKYPNGTWLIVYLNIPTHQISNYGSWNRIMLNMQENWDFMKNNGIFYKGISSVIVLKVSGDEYFKIF